MRDRLHGADQRTHGVFAVTALDGHDALRRARHVQSGIRLQARDTVRLCTRSHAGITSNALSVVSDYKVIHGIPCSVSMNERMVLPQDIITIKETFCHRIHADFSDAVS